MNSKPDYYDLVIIGGGMVGAALASAFSECDNFKILIVENQPLSNAVTPGFDARSIALSRSTVRFLYEQGLWKTLKESATPIRTLAVKQAHTWGGVNINAEEEGVPALGYVVENHQLGQVMIAATQLSHRITWMTQASVSRMTPINTGWRLAIEHSNPIQVETPLLVVADGAQSRTRSALGITHQCYSYRQKALVTNIETENAHEGRAFEWFIPGGSLALLPLPQNRLGVVWAFPESGHHDELPDLLKTLVEPRFGRIQHQGRQDLYPLHAIKSHEQVRPHTVILGNAAHTLHPIAGQGFNLAVRDVMTLSALLKAACGVNDSVLQTYQESRRRDQERIAFFCHHLVKGFQGQWPLANWVRTGALLAFDLWPQGKRLLGRHVIAPSGGTREVYESGI